MKLLNKFLTFCKNVIDECFRYSAEYHLNQISKYKEELIQLLIEKEHFLEEYPDSEHEVYLTYHRYQAYLAKELGYHLGKLYGKSEELAEEMCNELVHEAEKRLGRELKLK